MKFKTMTKRLFAGACACACACALIVVSGCAASDTSEQEAQAANRQYMTSVNQCMDNLADELADFSDAVSRNDVVSMRTQAENAFDVLDELAALQAPEGLLDIQAQYVEGCSKLEQALGDYVALYTEIETATDAQPFDYSSYDARLADIQKLYNDGLAQLEAGDALASGKE